jgi:iron complex outermembrane receptor protein
MVMGQSAWAQEDSGDEIVVTARRVEERLQDTPLSVTVVNAAALEDSQIASTVDLDQITPSLQFAPIAPLSGNNSAAQVFIRGIGQTDPTAGVDPGVGIYIDDVYMGSAVGGVMDFRDIESVQVLRGPQGTLFGRNTVGGAILLTSRDPGREFAGSARVGVGSDNLREAQFALDVPISENMLTRWTYGIRQRDGYVRRAIDGTDLGNENSYTLTGKVVITPSNAWRFEFHGDYTNADEHGTPLVFAAIREQAAFPAIQSVAAGCPGADGPPPPFNVPMIDDPRCANDFWNDGPFVANGTFPVQSLLENWGLGMTVDVTLNDKWSFRSISAYRNLAWDGNRDADNTPFTILHTEYHSDGYQASQEFQLTYDSDPLSIVSGLYFFKSNTVDLLTATLGSVPGGTSDLNDNIITNSNWAAFTQATYDITDALSVSAGLRFTEETKSSLPRQWNIANPANVYVLHQTFSRDFNATTGSASIQYRWSPEVMTYASWAQGFKSGGFNSRFNAPVPADPASGNPALHPPSFEPENAESYEIGAKLDPVRGLRVNLAAFDTSYQDIQLTYRFGVAPYIFNAGVATIRGFEGEVHYSPSADWLFDANFSYLDDQFDKIRPVTYAGSPPSSVPVTLNSQLPYVPEWQGSAALEYAAHLWADMRLRTRGEVVYTGAQFFDTGNPVEIAQNDDITTYNLSFLLERQSQPWQLRLGIKNLTDEIFPIAGNSSLPTGSGYAEIAYNRGREVSLAISTDF